MKLEELINGKSPLLDLEVMSYSMDPLSGIITIKLWSDLE